MVQRARPNPNEVVNYLLSLLLCQCAELQGFVRPLLELLNGLKRGRFDRGKPPRTVFHSSMCAVRQLDLSMPNRDYTSQVGSDYRNIVSVHSSLY